jgi:hypothetical protein
MTGFVVLVGFPWKTFSFLALNMDDESQGKFGFSGAHGDKLRWVSVAEILEVKKKTKSFVEFPCTCAKNFKNLLSPENQFFFSKILILPPGEFCHFGANAPPSPPKIKMSWRPCDGSVQYSIAG